MSRGDARHLFAELIELLRDLRDRQVRFHLGQQPRHRDVKNGTENAARDDDGHEDQRRHGHLVVKPSPGVEQQDHQNEDAEVDVRLHPLLDRAERRAVPALADAEERQQEAEEKPMIP